MLKFRLLFAMCVVFLLMVRFGNDLVCCSFYFCIHITKCYITPEFSYPENLKDKTVNIIGKFGSNVVRGSVNPI